MDKFWLIAPGIFKVLKQNNPEKIKSRKTILRYALNTCYHGIQRRRLHEYVPPVVQSFFETISVFVSQCFPFFI